MTEFRIKDEVETAEIDPNLVREMQRKGYSVSITSDGRIRVSTREGNDTPLLRGTFSEIELKRYLNGSTRGGDSKP